VTALLFEIGCEELPADVCADLERQLVGDGAAGAGGRDVTEKNGGSDRRGLVRRLLEEARLWAPARGSEQADLLAVLITPRRIGIRVAPVPARQTPSVQRFRGPRAEVAFDKGVPTKAGAGFARAKGVAPEDLARETVDGTEFVVAEIEEVRRPSIEVVPGFCAELLDHLHVPRGMRWGSRPDGVEDYLRFSRPIRWLVCKLGRRTVRFRFYDLECADLSLGHRVMGRPVKVINPDVYESRLEEQAVVADQRRRRTLIESGLDERAAALGGTWSDPGDVLAEAIYLVEWPTVLSGSFDEGHLRLPDDVLITAMQGHQRYFPVRDGDGALMPVFLYVCNADPQYAELITSGNTRVLNGRLDDAAFAYDRDVAMGIDAIAEKLDAVVFHEKLGSLAEKAVRLQDLSTWLAAGPEAFGTGEVDHGEVALAAGLAKADLASGMVQEFPTLQGRMGELYARSAGHPRVVATAIGEHYRPLSAMAPLPSSDVGRALAIADKADNIVGAWVAGEKPTGSRDPYALRRAAIGIVRIALEGDLRFPVDRLLERAAEAFADQGLDVDGAAVVSGTLAFVWERLEALLLDEGVDQECVQAALGSSAPDVPGVAVRARELARLRDLEILADAATAYTRCASLAAKAGTSTGEVTAELLLDAAEKALFDAYRETRERITASLASQDVEGALGAAAGLREPVDRYFDDVLVMDGDPDVRDNRLAQLAAVRDLLRQIADFSRIAV